MRSKWKGCFVLPKGEFFVPFSAFSFKLKLGDVLPVYTGKLWILLVYRHIYMSGYKLKNFVSSKLLGNIHSDKRKRRKKVGKKKKNG